MKSLLRNLVLGILEALAKLKLKKMDAKIVGVTGSVGKTSCKEMIASVLEKKYKILKSEKSYNSEFGLLLTILHQKSGFSSPFEWLKTIGGGFLRTFFVNDKYDFLILEMGVDKPGDMNFLLRNAPPDYAVMTAVKPVHLAEGQFVDMDDIFKEKKKIFSSITGKGAAIISLDDPYIKRVDEENLKSPKFTYSAINGSDLSAKNIIQTERGLTFNIQYKDNSYSFQTTLFGKYQLSMLLPAIAIGILTEVPVPAIKEAIAEFKLPPGRMSMIEGKNGALIIDSSYNASPVATKKALNILDFFGKARRKRRIFIFGNMNELGIKSKELHIEVGEKISKHADFLITVGEDARYAAETALKNGLNANKIVNANNVFEAIEEYKKIAEEGDVILVKGSQNKVRLEIFVEEFMAHPENAKELLVRQEKNWKNVDPR